jgi:hypothetical protein
MYPALHFIVQVDDYAATTSHRLISACESTAPLDRDPELNTQITVISRVMGTRQTNPDAAVYILHLPSSSRAILAELQVHLSVLRATSSIMLILTARLLPEAGSMPDPEIEAMARSRDLTLLQLANEGGRGQRRETGGDQ